MGKRHTNQEWQTLIEQSESSSLSTPAFCKGSSFLAVQSLVNTDGFQDVYEK